MKWLVAGRAGRVERNEETGAAGETEVVQLDVSRGCAVGCI